MKVKDVVDEKDPDSFLDVRFKFMNRIFEFSKYPADEDHVEIREVLDLRRKLYPSKATVRKYLLDCEVYEGEI